MKLLLSSRGLFSLGFLMLLATNIVVLSGVASNRSGRPESQATLTERELHLPYQVHEENSGLALRLRWRVLSMEADSNNFSDWRTPAWLSADKLEYLGFNKDNYLNAADNTIDYKQPIPKEVFIVLENDGALYREAVKRSERALEKERNSFKLSPDDIKLRDNVETAEKRLKRERIEETRLFAIDAGLDPRELRGKYGNQNRFIITKGLVQARYEHDKNKTKVFAYISKLSVASIHVPHKHRQVFVPIIDQGRSKKKDVRSPRFEVKIAYGSRFEPWIMSVRPMVDEAD